MKSYWKLGLIFLFGFLVAPAKPAFSQGSNAQLVQSVSCQQSGTSGSYSCTLTATGTGHLLTAQEFDFANIPGTPAAPAGWTQDCVKNNGAAGQITFFSYPNAPSGITTVTFTPSSGASSAVVSEWSGMATSAPFDGCDGYVDNAGIGAYWFSGAKLSSQTDLGVGAALNRTTSAAGFAPGDVWTALTDAPQAANSSEGWTEYITNGAQSPFTALGTLASTADVLSSVALYKSGVAGTMPTGDLVSSFSDFESSTNGTTLTTAILNAGTHGMGINQWTLDNAIAFTVCNAGNLPSYSNTTTNGTTYAAGAGTRGICYNMSSGGEAYESVPAESLTVTAYVNVNVGTNVTSPSAPVFVGTPGVDSAAFAINASGQLELECASANPQGYPISPTTLAVANTTYGVWLQYVGGGTHTIKIYSNPTTNPILIGSATCPSQGTNFATEVGIGEFQTGATGLAGTRGFDSLMWDVSGAIINLAPQGNTVSSFSDFENGSNGNTVTATILNAGTHGAGANQWTVDAGAFTVCNSANFPTYWPVTVIGGSTYPAGEGTRGICFNLQSGGEALETINSPTVTLYVNVNLGAIASVYSNPVIIGDFGVDDAGFTINSSGQLEMECPFATPEDYPITGSNQAQPNTTYGIWLQYVAGGHHSIKIYSNPTTNPQLIGTATCPAQGTHNATNLGFGDFHGGASGTATIREFDSLLWDVSGHGINVIPTGNTVQASVGTNPAGLSFSVDGTPYNSAQTLTWNIGTSHTLTTTASQSPAAGTQDNFVNWSDGTTAVSDAFTATSGTTSFTASFDTSYQLTTAANPAAGGTVSPTSGSYYAQGAVVPLVATPIGTYTFTGWTGNVANSSSASTTVTMNAPQSVTANFALPGTPVATLSTTSLSFASQTVGTTSAAQSVTLTNTGSASLSIQSMVTAGDFAASSCPSSLGINVACKISVTFTPTATGTRNGSITVTDNAAGSPHVITLTGTGTSSSGSTILLGDSNIESNVDENTLGQAQAWPYTASVTGSATTLSFYADSSTGNGPYIVGLYADAGGAPGALLASGSTTTTAGGKWNTVTLAASVNITAGTKYWLAMLGVSGNMVHFRDDGTVCSSVGSATGLKALPTTWTSSATWPSCPASVYASGSTSPAPSITGLSPSSGTVSTSVTISGANFGTTGTVTFNGTTATVTSWSAGSIVVTVPSAATSGNVVVTVGGVSSAGVPFTVTPNITGLSPASAPTGTSVTISGSGFGTTQGSSTVAFNGTAATVTSWNASSVVVTVPSAATTGNVVVTVVSVASNAVPFTVTPNITGLSPPSGPVGTSVTISGTGFGASQGSSTVTFNNTAATPTSWSNTSILVPVPSGTTTGSVVVTVGSAASNGVAFTVATPPSISSLTPASGTVGASVTIAGSNFGSTGSVTFNGTAATVTSWSAGSIVVTVPTAATTGNVVVTVGGLASSGVPFTVTPNITGLSAASATIGTSVTISGSGFGATQGSSTVTFNNTTATPTSWSATSIVVPVPSGATTGNVVVTVVSVASNAVGFTVTPNITSLSPSAGAVGTSVTISGTGFGSPQGSSTVTFGGTTATPTSWSATSIVAPVPAGAATGTVVVTVGGVASNGITFTVSATPPSITGLSPTSGIVGTTVTISGANFGASGTVTFNGAAATVTSWSPGSVVVTVPAAATTGNVVVTVASVASNSVPFTVTPNITGLSAASGLVGTSVTISGSGFGTTQGSSTVTFNGTVATVTGWSAASVVVTVPAAATTGNVLVTVASVASNGVAFTVTPNITGLSAASGPVGTSVSVSGSGFGATQGSSTVTFNGTAATPTSWSAASIVVPVPSGATTGNVVVTVASVASNGVAFTVTPHITSLSPASGLVGTSVTIAGTTFGSTQGSSTVTFNGITATPTSWSSTSIVAPVPSGAATGNVVVTVAGAASNGVSFAVSASGPSITGLSPASGVVGTSVTIMGANFGTTKGSSTVKFNGTTAAPTSWSATSIVVPVPSGATTGNVVVTVASVASNGVPFTVNPNITGLSPTSGAVGASVTVTGTAFGATAGSSSMAFNGTAATPTSWSATKIVAPVPSAATTGNVVVTVGGIASNGISFTVSPHITSLSPTSGAVGAFVTIAGTTFGSTQGSSTVKFNGTTATPTSWSTTSIVVPVPSGATTGNVVVTVAGAASNGVSFTVGHTVFVGDSNVETSVDYNTLGQAQAWPYTATTTGAVSTLWFYADSSTGNGPYIEGIYADAGGTPGALLASATIATTAGGKWNSMTLATPLNVTAGVKYWIALLGVSGNMVRFRDDGTACSSVGSGTGLTALPAMWTTTATWPSCPASVYGSN